MTDDAQPQARTGAWKSRPRRSDGPRLTRDEARRQGEIVTLAFTLLGGRDEAMAFLNSDSKALEARPIDLAMQSELGFSTVETLIRKMGESLASG
ncbi:MAG: DUF2384 domain-containing protein [Candidatus Andeanibacterium colombiense]|uniref:DUF2384 domain-containing protein n=1 Tax=Candidatus Andeanibacterium colombiense TaxID=3121345 RepID=A0AAJ6BP39_9SPHN|nr:MAG: DUF2384 domain-containing protein [Sphingomonadaceae bacterium]